ncbi:MAG: TetR/AcrR family transcriptional regulator [Roseivivax sp.]|nr:TetR/AcrR family transcriptional regulator [Roseivivax sp.]
MQRKSAEDRKTQIIAQVLRLASEIGPDRMSTTDVARAVGISQPAVFRHFPTKGDLWVAVAEDVAATIREHWAAAEALAQTPVERLRGLIGAQLAAIAERPALPSILFSRELTVDNPLLREVFDRLLASFLSRLAAAVGEMQSEDMLSPDIEARDAAVLLASIVQGVAIRWALGNRGFDLVGEGSRLVEVQLTLMSAGKGVVP